MSANRNQEVPSHLQSPPPHFVETFDLSLHIPTGQLDLIDTLILDSKKELFGSLLIENDTIRKVEQELRNADPTFAKQESSAITPTIASVFNIHEIFAIYLLRNLRLRELREILLRQLNFFCSIEKRIAKDVSLVCDLKISLLMQMTIAREA